MADEYPWTQAVPDDPHSVTPNQGRNEQVRRVRLADGRRLRGRIFPEFTVFIPKNREYLAQLSVRSTRIFFGATKRFMGPKMAIRGAKLTFGGGKKIRSTKSFGGGGGGGGGRKNGCKGRQINVRCWENILGIQKASGWGAPKWLKGTPN